MARKDPRSVSEPQRLAGDAVSGRLSAMAQKKVYRAVAVGLTTLASANLPTHVVALTRGVRLTDNRMLQL
jgi:hypothetical protein